MVRVRCSDLTRNWQGRALRPYGARPKLPKLLTNDFRSGVAEPFVKFLSGGTATNIWQICAESSVGEGIDIGDKVVLAIGRRQDQMSTRVEQIYHGTKSGRVIFNMLDHGYTSDHIKRLFEIWRPYVVIKDFPMAIYHAARPIIADVIYCCYYTPTTVEQTWKRSRPCSYIEHGNRT